MRTVRTKRQLKDAIEDEVPDIQVLGDAAEELNKALKVRSASRWSFGVLGAALGAAPFTGGLSAVAAAPIAALTGTQIVVIVAIAAIWLVVVTAIIKEYDVIEVDVSPEGELRLRLRRKGSVAF